MHTVQQKRKTQKEFFLLRGRIKQHRNLFTFADHILVDHGDVGAVVAVGAYNTGFSFIVLFCSLIISCHCCECKLTSHAVSIFFSLPIFFPHSPVSLFCFSRFFFLCVAFRLIYSLSLHSLLLSLPFPTNHLPYKSTLIVCSSYLQFIERKKRLYLRFTIKCQLFIIIFEHHPFLIHNTTIHCGGGGKDVEWCTVTRLDSFCLAVMNGLLSF